MSDEPFRIRRLRVATLPNLLSLVRVLLLAPSILALERQPETGPVPALLTIGVALGTDAVDGLVARWRGWVSEVGRVLDPLADKLYIGGLVVYLSLARDFPVWLLALVLARDLLLVGGTALLLRRYGVAFAANAWGKVSTILLSVLVFAYVLQVREVIPWLIGATLVALALSLGAYVRNALRYVRRGLPRPA